MPLPLFAPIDRWLVPLPGPRKLEWLGSCTYAHRGLHGPGVPENSLGAFAAAVVRGLGIELDVQCSSDGQAMVFHDWDLDRLTGESGPLAARSASALGRIVLAGSGEGIPSLRQVLDEVAGRVPLLVEIKTRRETRVPPLCLAVRRVLEGYRGPHAVIGFDPRVIRWFAVYSPLTPRGLSFTDDGNKSLLRRIRRRLALRHARPDFITYNIRDLPDRFAARQRRRGLGLVAWTIDTPELAARAAHHADAMIAEGAGLP
jgi:glycerophosphoryl diester phosphodiesterase